ncbi:MAG: endonuclease V [Chloroflexi bacterium]|nr:endonuclease V [Chloroflexota bacterium]
MASPVDRDRLTQARELQKRLQQQVRIEPLDASPARVAGIDVHFEPNGDRAWGSACVVSCPDLQVIECKIAAAAIDFPYRTGYLSFRELPAVAAVLTALAERPDLLLLDGHGIAHPRRFGLACHAGVEFDLPAVGCAKSRLCGRFVDPDKEALARSDLTDGAEVLGKVLRSRAAVKPIFVSVGHRITLDQAVDAVIGCLDGFRIPLPLRMAHNRARSAARNGGV